MTTTSPAASTLVDLLRARTATQGASLLYRYLLEGEVDGASIELTYGDFDLRARAIAAALAEADGYGERALMLYPPGLDFMAGFFGCLYAGTIAVPAYPPDPERLDRTLARLKSIASDCKARFVVTTSAIKRIARDLLAGVPELASLIWIATDEIDLARAATWSRPAFEPGSVAFLQYTSGSTGDPKGVVVTHENLMRNERALSLAFGEGARRDHVSWLPLYHDMGLIGKALHAPFAGVACTFFAPLDFLKRPVRWLQAVARFCAGYCAAPNFAYDLCARKVLDRDLEGLDLSSWTVAVNAAEPVRAATLDRFVARFARYGFRREAFLPGYGLAEATLFVAAGDASAPPRTFAVSARSLEQGVVAEPASRADARSYVGCGHAWDDDAIRIVDPETLAPCAAGRVGEIWVAGPSVGQGYWNRPEESARTFGARVAGGEAEGPFLRTGDLGFVRDGELLVSGRLKDLIILRGRNHLPNDLENTIENAHGAVRNGCSAAFAVDEGGEERLVVVAEIEPAAEAQAASAADAVRRAVAEEHEVAMGTLVFVKARTILKTTSGKIQRRGTRAAWAAGELSVIATFQSPPSSPPAREATVAPLDTALAASSPAARLELAARFVLDDVARALGQPASAIDADASLRRAGLDSLGAVELRSRLEAAIGAPLPTSIEQQSPTPRSLAEAMLASWLAGRVARSSAEGPPTDGGGGEEEVF